MSTYKENKHSIAIAGDFSDVLPEIILWGEASWWPENSLMRFVRYGQDKVQLGTQYRQKVLLPFAPSWDVQVEKLTEKSITRRFLNGMFEGSESVSLERCGSGIEVRYVMNYKINGFIDKFLWLFVFEKLHNRNIEEILTSLKNYLEKKG